MNALAPVASLNLQSDVSDESLIAQYRESEDRGLFEALMRRYEREMYSYLRRYIGNAEMAEDALQGTFLQVHLKCHFVWMSSFYVGVCDKPFVSELS